LRFGLRLGLPRRQRLGFPLGFPRRCFFPGWLRLGRGGFTPGRGYRTSRRRRGAQRGKFAFQRLYAPLQGGDGVLPLYCDDQPGERQCDDGQNAEDAEQPEDFHNGSPAGIAWPCPASSNYKDLSRPTELPDSAMAPLRTRIKSADGRLRNIQRRVDCRAGRQTISSRLQPGFP
jgi:hypothetical protein